MSYFNNLSRNQKLATFVGLFVLGTGLALSSLPYNKTLTANASLPADVAVNLPCASAILRPGEKTNITVTLTADGMGQASLLLEGSELDGGELKLRHWGLMRNISCGLTINIGPEQTIRLPASMPFAAQNGVRPLPLGGQAWRAFSR